jgi:hypothetical protein
MRSYYLGAVLTALAVFAMTGPAAAGWLGRNASIPGPGYYWQCNSGVASYLQWNDQPATCISDVYGRYTDYGVWRCASPWWITAYSWRCE